MRPDVAHEFVHARGRLIVTSDGDLQNDPRDIPAMVRRLEDDQLDIVCGWRKNRKDAFFSRLLPSRVANKLISWATGVPLHDYGCSLKVFRAEVVSTMQRARSATWSRTTSSRSWPIWPWSLLSESTASRCAMKKSRS